MGPWTGKLIRGTDELDLTYGVPEKINMFPAGTEILKVTDVRKLNVPFHDEASGETWDMYVIVWYRIPLEAKTA